MKKYTKAQFKKTIKEWTNKYSFLSEDEVINQLLKQYPSQFEAIAAAQIDLTRESMGI